MSKMSAEIYYSTIPPFSSILAFSFFTSAVSLLAQVQLHAKYPLFDSQSECRFTLSSAIL